MIKKRELQECTSLYELMAEPSVMKYVRYKADSADEYWFMTRQLMEEEEKGLAITRTIISDFGQPIGTINLFDIEDGAGFLGTWIGKPFQGLGYNKKAKEQFLEELFFELDIHSVFLRIRKTNVQSIRATEKLRYAQNANTTHPSIYEAINKEDDIFDLYHISKDLFHFVMLQENNVEEQAM
ncbi:GNAT family N-acetyltransferase [Psychrobacillus sp.]|uniref:GNAT family N-acetyltransferase n=1 Tax=Psychrobacillus sp. TaxID=1871623 RepID=UPI0028BDA571|nr:GNAT family N-acetyltransferase [Psychrobacillus sp.]